MVEFNDAFMDYFFQKTELHNCPNFSKSPGENWGCNLWELWLVKMWPSSSQLFGLLWCQLGLGPVRLLLFGLSAGLTTLVETTSSRRLSWPMWPLTWEEKACLQQLLCKPSPEEAEVSQLMLTLNTWCATCVGIYTLCLGFRMYTL